MHLSQEEMIHIELIVVTKAKMVVNVFNIENYYSGRQRTSFFKVLTKQSRVLL
jgi:hypothetical protein